MNVDTRAVEAAQAVRNTVEIDLEAGLRELARRRRRRRLETALAVAAVVALGLVAVDPLVGAQQDDPDPAGQRPMSSIFYTRQDSTTEVGVVRVGEDLDSSSSLDVGLDPSDMAVSPDGTTLAVVSGAEDGLRLVDLRTGQTSSRHCSRCFEIAWLSGEEVLTRGFTSDDAPQVLRHDVVGGEPSRSFRVPEGTPLAGLTSQGDLAASVHPVTGEGTYRLVVGPRLGGPGVALVTTTTPPSGFITHVDWSPDASRIGYVVREPVDDAVGGHRYRLYTVLPDGSYPSEVADLGRCVCSENLPPSFDWAPDGNSIVTVIGDPIRGRDRFRLASVDMEEVAATAPEHRRALLQEVARDATSPLTWGSTSR